MSSWGKKLETKLSSLTDSASTESLQTIAKWVSFNRKRTTDFWPVLLDSLRKSSANRQATLIQLTHQVIMQERDSEKWEKLADFRQEIGESVLFVVAEELSAPAKQAVQDCFQEWDDNNVFGGPTVLSQIKRKLAADPVKQEKETSSPSKPAVLPHEPQGIPSDSKTNDLLLEEAPVKQTPSLHLVSSQHTDISYDFDSKNVPQKDVPIKDLIQPAKQLATTQISRDIQHGSAVDLSSALSGLPEDVRRVLAQAGQDGDVVAASYELLSEQADAFSKSIDEDLINANLEEKLAGVRLFRNIIGQQNKARRKAIDLLIQCRAKIGASETVEEFLKADRAQNELKKRKQILLDALELEGVAPDDAEANRDPVAEDNLQVPEWYQSSNEEEPPTKRAKVGGSS